MSYRPEWLVGYFGIIKAGAKAIVLNSILKPSDYRNLLQDSDSSAMLTDQSMSAILKDVIPALPGLKTVCNWDSSEFARALDKAPDTMPDVDLSDTEECTIVYTSGVLGKQKGVVHTHESIMEAVRILTRELEVSGDDVIVGMIPFFYLLGLAVVALISVGAGATIVLLPRFSPANVLEVVDRERATVLIGVPAMFNALAQVDQSLIDRYDVSSLRAAVGAGAKSSAQLMADLENKYNLTFCEIYGTTEAIGSSISAMRDRKLGSVGKPLQEIRIIDGDGQEVPACEVGQLVVRSPMLMRGYYNAPELTAKVLRDGWFYTGDLVRRDDDGCLEYIEKQSFIIVTAGGTKIPPTEVEDVMLTHPDVAELAYIGVRRPDGNQIPTLFVVPRADSDLTKSEVRRFCAENIAAHRLPQRIEFVEAIPKTGSGKIDRATLMNACVA